MSRVDDVDEMSDEKVFEISWLEIFLTLAMLGLCFQLWPIVYSFVADFIIVPLRFLFATCDVRQWGWRSYAVANVLAFIGLAVIRFRQIQDS